MSYTPVPGMPLGFSYMPGGGKFVVVMLWIRFGTYCGAAVNLVVVVGANYLIPQTAALLPDWYDGFAAFRIIQFGIWAILYGVFALKLPERSSSARTSAIILELVGLALTGVSNVIVQETFTDLAELGAILTFVYAGLVIELVLSILIISFLVGRDMKHWCDR